ncbi:hypothetical protein BT96DRAFT_964064 [Gymnopus androsaceus JB14]|uniref:NTF2 domain-containing protein n=1 Tax=Gymnopus androsaceus JB14 TaxID=1447944 RepID=A0A6A4I6J7_9AGAR|nr:hypothetical protein BT96DRAFT_964064 [Gymnopus androsaceus JB14]
MTSNGTPHHNAIPSEVGWQFVPQYYNFVNKEPERLHCFYNKRSTFIHGAEGEDGKTCHGQQEIHAQITSLGFQDCKIFIHSVDAQSSADGGIIIQVIGEMSNNSGPWRKFVQTFFLAEQPNGYFVLNDIFRFLKEDSVEGEADEPEPAAVADEPAPASEPVPAPPEFMREPSPPPPVEVVDTTAAPVEEPSVTVADIAEPAPAPEPAAQLNGYEAEKPPTPAPVSKSPTPAPPSPPPPAVAAAEPSPSPAPPVAAAPPPAPIAAPAPVPAAPPAAPVPKTWANLAATNTKKWGSAVAHDSRGSSENVPSSPAAASTSSAQTPAKAPATPQSRTPHPAYAAAQSVTTAQCFIKSVTEPITQQALTAALTRFGQLKGPVEIVPHKACAFAEFTTIDAAKRAIIISLSPAAGGEGGVKVDVGGGESMRIIVETKKERGDRPVNNRGRGGPPFAGGRGGGSDTRGGAGGGNAGGGGGFRGGPRGSGPRGRGAK